MWEVKTAVVLVTGPLLFPKEHCPRMDLRVRPLSVIMQGGAGGEEEPRK